MTTEQRVYISVTELLEIEFRCKKCNVIFAWPLSGEGFRIGNCPGCNTEWCKSEDHRKKNIDQIILGFRGLRETLKDAAFDLRFRIEAGSSVRISASREANERD